MQSVNSNQVSPERQRFLNSEWNVRLFPSWFFIVKLLEVVRNHILCSNYISGTAVSCSWFWLVLPERTVLKNGVQAGVCSHQGVSSPQLCMVSNKLLSFRAITSIMGFIAFLSSPCNFQQGPLTRLMWNICSCLICLSPAMFMFSLSCTRLMVGVEPPASSDYVSHWIIVITEGCIWSLLSAVALHDKVNKQKVTEHQKISASSHMDNCWQWDFFPPVIMIRFYYGFSCKMPLELKSRIHN